MNLSNKDQDEKILLELKKLNQKLDKISNNNRFFIYNTHPAKFAFLNFLGGTFSSLGTIFGTVIVASFVIYIFSKINFTHAISNWISNTLVQVNWSKIIVPQIQTIQQKMVNQN